MTAKFDKDTHKDLVSIVSSSVIYRPMEPQKRSKNPLQFVIALELQVNDLYIRADFWSKDKLFFR